MKDNLLHESYWNSVILGIKELKKIVLKDQWIIDECIDFKKLIKISNKCDVK